MVNKLYKLSFVVALVATLVESFTYTGFIKSHFFINSSYLVIFLILTGFLKIIFDKKDIKTKIAICDVVPFLMSLILYVSFKLFDRFIYPNFVFSKVHIQPDNLFWVAVVLSIPVFVAVVKIDYSKKESRLPTAIMALCLSLVGFNLFKIYKIINSSLIFMIKNPTATYEVKMQEKVGKTFYKYTQFIDTYTPEDANLLIPPQAFPWPQSGNGAFLRYFTYPRNLGNGGEFSAGTNINWKNIDFVLLDWGETPTTEGKYTHEWPKFDVPADKIIFMNEDGTFASEIKGDYKYANYKGKKVWGLIVVKH